ncbi:MAG: hypothetical protein K8T26_00470 [Lentisphaerae bacterium]|nr:hypothetical protein [Lentisphaerota bacterium]
MPDATPPGASLPPPAAPPPPPPAQRRPLLVLAILAIIAAFTLWNIPPHLLLLDTMTVGGDTPAHNYLASHLRESLFHHGRIVSWAPGWWAGFPAFQYYFCLPYLVIAAASYLMPFNVAFKCVNVLGILILPACAWYFARTLRLPRPVPALLTVAMLPFLFVKTHTMWGVNVYSTLAGMIANSLSFPIMLLTIASAYDDAHTGRARLRTAALAALMLASHFFTSVMAGITLAALPFLMPRHLLRQTLTTLATTGLRAALLMAWWLVPLVAKGAYSVDFGRNWEQSLAQTLPAYTLGLIPFILLALGLERRAPHRSAVLLIGWMFASACALYFHGFDLSPVFVNVRLWPFVFFALLALAATGLGLAVRQRPGQAFLVLALLAAAGVYIADQEREVRHGTAPLRDWAAFNYGGLERRPAYRAFHDLILPLDGTPGRLANDLCEENNAMGSSRITEAVPHLIDKPIIEGGLVNSGLSSYFTYYIQCEMSESCAGFPTIVNPTTFNLVNGTRHLELFNVKHFLARWPVVQYALAASPMWRRVGTADEWQLFELLTHDGRQVFIPPNWPIAFTSDRWREDALEWFYTPELLDQPIVFVPPGEEDGALPAPATLGPPVATSPVLPAARFRQIVSAARRASGDIDEWLHLGPFPYPREAVDPLAVAPITESNLDPREGDRAGGLSWRILFTRSPIFPSRFYNQTDYLVAYSFVNIFSPTARDAVLHYGNDDGAAIWLNDEPVVRDSNTGLGTLRTQGIHLRQGRNRLLHKSQQSVGGHFFHVRVTDPDGKPFPDVVCSTAETPPDPTPLTVTPVEHTGRGILSESDRPDRIRFTTDAIGLPHMVKVSYFPNWKVRGARRVYRVTPAFLLVYPDQPEVEIYYGRTASDVAGLGLTALGWLLCAATLSHRRRRGGTPRPTS